MAEAVRPDVLVHVCQNCIPGGERLPRQWMQDGLHVLIRQVPCGGKTDAQYLFHALESGCRGVCVVTCPSAQCHLAQGNYRAEVRIDTIRRLLAEIGLDRRRAQLIRCDSGEKPGALEGMIRSAVGEVSRVSDAAGAAVKSG